MSSRKRKVVADEDEDPTKIDFEIAPKTSLNLITYYVFREWSTSKLSFSTFDSKRTDGKLLSLDRNI